MAKPAPANCANGSRAREALSSKRTVISPNNAAISAQSAMPNSSPATAKMKSAWASGSDSFTVPWPGPVPVSPPWMKASSERST